jgi:hypothetical protein
MSRRFKSRAKLSSLKGMMPYFPIISDTERIAGSGSYVVESRHMLGTKISGANLTLSFFSFIFKGYSVKIGAGGHFLNTRSSAFFLMAAMLDPQRCRVFSGRGCRADPGSRVSLSAPDKVPGRKIFQAVSRGSGFTRFVRQHFFADADFASRSVQGLTACPPSE